MQQRDPENQATPVNPFENLTEEERLVLIECRRNSVYRGVPIAILTGFLSSRLIPLSRVSFLTNYNWQWTLVASVVSYFWGVRSYQNVCMDKLMSLEHSNIADWKRKSIAMKQQHNIPLNSWEQKWASVQAYRSSLDDDVPYHVAEMSDSYKGQEPHPPAQSDMVMFAPSNAGESKQSEKPRRRTFEDIRAENRKHRIHANQEPSHVPHDHNTVGESQSSQGNIRKRPPRRNQYGDIIYDDE